MARIYVKSQAELDAAIAALEVGVYTEIVLEGSESYVLQQNIDAHVVAWGSVQLRIFQEVTVQSKSRFVSIVNHSPDTMIDGNAGVVVIPPITTIEDWCAYYGAEPAADDPSLIILYKAVHDDYQSTYGMDYSPGTMPEAPDWDGGKAECGGGLHFCASPLEALSFDTEATRFIACPVRLQDIAVHPNATMPSKVKAPRVAAPCYEVDRHGWALAPTPVSVEV